MSARPTIPLGTAREMLFVTLARGVPENGPHWGTPKGGKIEVRVMEKLGAFRFTLDLIPPDPWPETWSLSPGAALSGGETDE